MNQKLRLYARALRANQWIKNLVVFVSILFAGKLFDFNLILTTSYAFFIYCILSSASYVLNDIIDYPFDRKHPTKKLRPISSGKISIPEATFIVFTLSLVGLLLSLLINLQFFLISLFFLLVHFYYSLYLKKFPVVDIFTISLSFILRTVAGVAATGYHVPVWLLMTIFFISLFMASVKRHAELVSSGSKARESLSRYRNHLLYFFSSTFATLTIVSYALFTYTLYVDPSQRIFADQTICTRANLSPAEQSFCQNDEFLWLLPDFIPSFTARKLMMLTIPFVVYGIARYAQLLYEQEEGERPERLIVTDKPLIGTIAIWGLSVILLIYLF